VWCKGLTTHTDVRLKKYGKKISDKFTVEKRKKYSNKMAIMRKDGTIPTLYKENSSQWKGGVSSIQNVARNDKRLYEQWKYPILIRDQFKCVDCGSGRDLHVHHNCETFSDIIKKVMTLDDYEKVEDYDTKKRVTDKIVEYHVKNNVSGITLCKECHNKLHPSLNFY
jgi:hypothetical protein